MKTFTQHPSLPIQEWKNYIGKQKNNENPFKFLFQAWCGEASLLLKGCKVVIGGFNEKHCHAYYVPGQKQSRETKVCLSIG